MFEKNYASGGGIPQPTSLIIHYWTQFQTTSFNLNSNIDEWMGLGVTSSLGTEGARASLVTRSIVLQDFSINITLGSHDAEITFTQVIDGLNTSRAITIPASAGAAIFRNEGSTPVIRDQTFSWKIEGGGGTGNTAMRGLSVDFS